jgi:hypothetical protein
MNDRLAKARLPRIECLITFIPVSEGGRSHPFPAGGLSGEVYRPHLVVGDPRQRGSLSAGNRSTEEYLGVAFHQDPVDGAAGSEMKVTVTLMYYPRVSYDKLKPGVTFTVREGARIVGFGSVLRWLDF